MLPRTSRTIAPQQAGLADAMRDRTRALHARAERSGVLRALLGGTATHAAYTLLLRNLLPVYRALEHGLERRSASLQALAQPAVFRAQAIEHDLEALSGDAWPDLPLLTAGARYAAQVGAAGEESDGRLAAHAYVRFLGDLNGGRLMRSALVRSLRLEAAALSFYDFPGAPDLPSFRSEYRAAFDRLVLTADEREQALREAQLAFSMNIDLSESIARAAPAQR